MSFPNETSIANGIEGLFGFVKYVDHAYSSPSSMSLAKKASMAKTPLPIRPHTMIMKVQESSSEYMVPESQDQQTMVAIETKGVEESSRKDTEREAEKQEILPCSKTAALSSHKCIQSSSSKNGENSTLSVTQNSKSTTAQEERVPSQNNIKVKADIRKSDPNKRKMKDLTFSPFSFREAKDATIGIASLRTESGEKDIRRSTRLQYKKSSLAESYLSDEENKDPNSKDPEIRQPNRSLSQTLKSVRPQCLSSVSKVRQDSTKGNQTENLTTRANEVIAMDHYDESHRKHIRTLKTKTSTKGLLTTNGVAESALKSRQNVRSLTDDQEVGNELPWAPYNFYKQCNEQSLVEIDFESNLPFRESLKTPTPCLERRRELSEEETPRRDRENCFPLLVEKISSVQSLNSVFDSVVANSKRDLSMSKKKKKSPLVLASEFKSEKTKANPLFTVSSNKKKAAQSPLCGSISQDQDKHCKRLDNRNRPADQKSNKTLRITSDKSPCNSIQVNEIEDILKKFAASCHEIVNQTSEEEQGDQAQVFHEGLDTRPSPNFSPLVTSKGCEISVTSFEDSGIATDTSRVHDGNIQSLKSPIDQSSLYLTRHTENRQGDTSTKWDLMIDADSKTSDSFKEEDLMKKKQTKSNGAYKTQNHRCGAERITRKVQEKTKSNTGTSLVHDIKVSKTNDQLDISEEIETFLQSFGTSIGKSMKDRQKTLDSLAKSIMDVIFEGCNEIRTKQSLDRTLLVDSFVEQLGVEEDSCRKELAKQREKQKNLKVLLEKHFSEAEECGNYIEKRIGNMKKVRELLVGKLQDMEQKHDDDREKAQEQFTRQISKIQKKFLKRTSQEEMFSVKRSLQSIINNI